MKIFSKQNIPFTFLWNFNGATSLMSLFIQLQFFFKFSVNSLLDIRLR